jgi:hypothetical protein
MAMRWPLWEVMMIVSPDGNPVGLDEYEFDKN